MLDKRPGLRPVSIGETLCRVFTKLVRRAAGDQAKTACGNLQLCAGLEAGIEGATHNVGQQRMERVKQRQREEEEVEGKRGGVVAGLNNITRYTAGTEEEAAEGLEVALGMEFENDRGSEGEEGGEGTLRAQGALAFVTQDAEQSGTTLAYARTGFNDLSRLEMMWTVRH